MSVPLPAAIAAESAVLQRFVAVLEEEQKRLIGGNADAVLPLLEQKTALITELGNAGLQREAALQALGVEPEKEAINTWLATAPKEVRLAWQNLMDLAQAANRLNSTNGQLINTRLQHNQQALAVLMNATGGLASNTTYGPDGHQKHDSGSRKLGSA